MKVYSGSGRDKLTPESLTEHLAQQEVVRVGLGHQRILSVYVLPAKSWVGRVNALYGAEAKDEEVRHVTLRSLRNEAVIGSILMSAVDADWKPVGFGVLVSKGKQEEREDGKHLAYLVPALPYWEALVQEKTGGGDAE